MAGGGGKEDFALHLFAPAKPQKDNSRACFFAGVV